MIYSILFHVLCTRKTYVEGMMYIQAPFRKLNVLPENYDVSLRQRLGLNTNDSCSINLEARMDGHPSLMWR